MILCAERMSLHPLAAANLLKIIRKLPLFARGSPNDTRQPECLAIATMSARNVVVFPFRRRGEIHLPNRELFPLIKVVSLRSIKIVLLQRITCGYIARFFIFKYYIPLSELSRREPQIFRISFSRLHTFKKLLIFQ